MRKIPRNLALVIGKISVNPDMLKPVKVFQHC